MRALTLTRMAKNNPLVFSGIIVIVFTLLIITLPANAGEGEVVLIAAKGSGIDAMAVVDVRRLYLGYKSASSRPVANPVLNIQSEALYDEFLKNIMHMTEGSYKRKLVKRIFRQGAEAIREIASLNELNSHLQENIGDISFVKAASLEKMNNIEVVQILW